jgi:HAMP domain-containing protein
VCDALRDFVYDTKIDLALPGNTLGSVHFGLSLVSMASLRDNVLRQSLVIAGIELLLSLLLLSSGGWLITRHVAHLLGATRAIARGDYAQRIVIPGKDEIGSGRRLQRDDRRGAGTYRRLAQVAGGTTGQRAEIPQHL